ncbi:hypothetical protein SLEP1_g60281 [Rubroshorea leprosula]|uniref:Uncharacterized protein n=1 Tax=Rubroshorea leprosula TaxID=152421 RepID=A0AAV5MUU8_9ROSI|nr:hypothetical protein SLEP1_g60281 [Rubroshorea leprosula]
MVNSCFSILIAWLNLILILGECRLVVEFLRHSTLHSCVPIFFQAFIFSIDFILLQFLKFLYVI